MSETAQEVPAVHDTVTMGAVLVLRTLMRTDTTTGIVITGIMEGRDEAPVPSGVACPTTESATERNFTIILVAGQGPSVQIVEPVRVGLGVVEALKLLRMAEGGAAKIGLDQGRGELLLLLDSSSLLRLLRLHASLLMAHTDQILLSRYRRPQRITTTTATIDPSPDKRIDEAAKAGLQTGTILALRD